MCRLATALLLCLIGAAAAADDIVLRTAVKPADAWVGQRVVLQVDVLGADGWAQITKFGDVELPGAYLIRTGGQGARLQESIDGKSYSGQRYEVSVYPQRAGQITVPPLPVEVQVKTWGPGVAQPVQRMQTPAVTIHARLPPGAEAVSGLVSTTRLSAEQQWAPALASARVGDAVQRVVIFEADDVSGMAFTPLRHDDSAAVGIYPAEAEVADSSDRGTLTGRRTERVTYVFERAGTVSIPAIERTWWNVTTRRLETVTLAGRDFDVSPGPTDSGDAAAPVSGRVSIRDLWLPAVIVFVAGVLLLRFGRPLLRRWQAWRRRRRESEQRFFNDALRSVGARDARLALRDIMRWLDRINEDQLPAQLDQFVNRYADDDARPVIDQLLRAAAGDARLADPVSLSRVLTAMRKRWRDAQRPGTGIGYVLPGLNDPSAHRGMLGER